MAYPRGRMARHSLSTPVDPLALAPGIAPRATGRELYSQPRAARWTQPAFRRHDPRHRSPARAPRLLAIRLVVPGTDHALRGAAGDTIDRRLAIDGGRPAGPLCGRARGRHPLAFRGFRLSGAGSDAVRHRRDRLSGGRAA